jgi:hypothetical protein
LMSFHVHYYLMNNYVCLVMVEGRTNAEMGREPADGCHVCQKTPRIAADSMLISSEQERSLGCFLLFCNARFKLSKGISL